MPIHPYTKSPSLKFRLARKAISLTTGENNLNEDFDQGKFPTQSFSIKKSALKKKVKANKAIDGFDVFYASGKKSNGTVVFYLHGGAYVNGVLKVHYDFLNKLVEHTQIDLVVPDYPMTPDYTYKQTLPMVQQAYLDLLKTTDAQNVIFMGDSAGGGLALGLYLKLKQEQQPLPRRLVLISPWVDVSLENTEIYKYLIKEPMLKDLNGLQRAGRVFADGERYHPFVSPIYGDFTDAPPIDIFIGDNDIFYPDCVKFYQQLEQQGVDAHLYPYREMIHCWLIAQTFKESRYAFAEIEKIITA